ncbi:MAG TPA: hypothetical protein VLA72_01870 [Anaerolineales bacterium]|nr:hypothetical protein [Anaerolineales bacterium]
MYSDETFPAGEYSLLYLSEVNLPGTVLQITDGQIVRIDTVFDTSSEGLTGVLDRNALGVILLSK